MCGLLVILSGCGPAPSQPRQPPATSPPTAAPSSTPATSAPATPSPASTVVTAPKIIAFTQLRRVETGNTGAEVTTAAQFDRFIGQAADDQVRAAVQQHRRPGVRLFAFILTGCQFDGASLIITSTRLWAMPTGGEGIQCVAAEYYLAVFAVPADRVPANVRVG